MKVLDHGNEQRPSWMDVALPSEKAASKIRAKNSLPCLAYKSKCSYGEKISTLEQDRIPFNHSYTQEIKSEHPNTLDH